MIQKFTIWQLMAQHLVMIFSERISYNATFYNSVILLKKLLHNEVIFWHNVFKHNIFLYNIYLQHYDTISCDITSLSYDTYLMIQYLLTTLRTISYDNIFCHMIPTLWYNIYLQHYAQYHVTTSSVIWYLSYDTISTYNITTQYHVTTSSVIWYLSYDTISTYNITTQYHVTTSSVIWYLSYDTSHDILIRHSVTRHNICQHNIFAPVRHKASLPPRWSLALSRGAARPWWHWWWTEMTPDDLGYTRDIPSVRISYKYS